MFKKIIFATTASPACDNAARVAFDLADKYDSELIAMHVYGIPSRGFSPYLTDISTGKQDGGDPAHNEAVQEEIKSTYTEQIAACKKYTIEARTGVPHTEVLRYARQNDADLIVMGAHTRDEEVGATRYRNVAGSTMQKVAKAARCPVLIISRPCSTCFWYFSNIVFCADFSKASHSAFLFAYKVAKEIGCMLHIFHTVDISGIHSGKTEEQLEIEDKINAAKQKIESFYLSDQGDDFDNYQIEVREGIPYVEILKYAREKNGDLIVMAHHTREIDPEKALLGSTVEQVVLRSACPVASVNHPDKLSA